MSQQDPFYQEIYNVSATAPPMQPISMYMQPAPQVSMSSHLNEQSLQAIRTMVREEVRKALSEIITEIRMQIGSRE